MEYPIVLHSEQIEEALRTKHILGSKNSPLDIEVILTKQHFSNPPLDEIYFMKFGSLWIDANEQCCNAIVGKPTCNVMYFTMHAHPSKRENLLLVLIKDILEGDIKMQICPSRLVSNHWESLGIPKIHGTTLYFPIIRIPGSRFENTITSL